MDTRLVNDSREILNRACSYPFHCVLHLWECTKHGMAVGLGGWESTLLVRPEQLRKAQGTCHVLKMTERPEQWQLGQVGDETKLRTVAITLTHNLSEPCTPRKAHGLVVPRPAAAALRLWDASQSLEGFRQPDFWFTSSEVGSENLHF